MTHQRKVLKCQIEIHRHSEECYDRENKEKLLCGMADCVVHRKTPACNACRKNIGIRKDITAGPAR